MILIILFLILGISIALLVKTDLFVALLTTMFSGIILVTALIGLPISHYTVKCEIAQFKSVEETLTIARAGGTNIESASFQLEIANMNKWLSRVQYWNGTMFDIYIPDEVNKLRPIR